MYGGGGTKVVRNCGAQVVSHRSVISHCCHPLHAFFYYFLYLHFKCYPLSPSESPISHPHLAPPLTHPLLIPCPGTPLHWGIEPSQGQGPLLPLMLDKDILCHICSGSHKFHHVYSLVGVLVPGSSGYTGWFILLFLLWAANSFSSLGPFSSFSIRDPILSSMVGCEYPTLYLSVTGRASQERAISDSCQQALVGIHNSV